MSGAALRCPPYAELHCLSNFTFLRGASHPEELVERAAELGLSAITITDRNSLAGVVRAHVAAKQAGIRLVVGARIVYGMAGYRALPRSLGGVSRKYATPVTATIVFGMVVVAFTWVYLLATSVQNAFTDVVDLSGIVFALFYVLTALASLAYYRRRLLAGPVNAIVLGLLPLGAAAFLIWMSWDSLATSPAGQQWSMAGIVAVGLVLMLAARFVLRSPFFAIRRESDAGTARV